MRGHASLHSTVESEIRGRSEVNVHWESTKYTPWRTHCTRTSQKCRLVSSGETLEEIPNRPLLIT